MKKIKILSFALLAFALLPTAEAQTTSCVGNASLTVVIEDCTDVESVLIDAAIKISPNPVSDGFNLMLPNVLTATKCQIKMCDVAGRVVFETQSIDQSSLYIPTAKLSAGMYVLSISDSDNHVFQRKIQKY